MSLNGSAPTSPCQGRPIPTLPKPKSTLAARTSRDFRCSFPRSGRSFSKAPTSSALVSASTRTCCRTSAAGSAWSTARKCRFSAAARSTAARGTTNFGALVVGTNDKPGVVADEATMAVARVKQNILRAVVVRRDRDRRRSDWPHRKLAGGRRLHLRDLTLSRRQELSRRCLGSCHGPRRSGW